MYVMTHIMYFVISFSLVTVLGILMYEYIYLSIYVCMYLCHAMDPGNSEVTMLKEPISFLAHCDVIEQPAKTDTLAISDRKGLKAS